MGKRETSKLGGMVEAGCDLELPVVHLVHGLLVPLDERVVEELRHDRRLPHLNNKMSKHFPAQIS